MLYRITLNGTIEATDTVDAAEKIAAHFDWWARSMSGEEGINPQTFGYDSQIRLVPIRQIVVEEEIGPDVDSSARSHS